MQDQHLSISVAVTTDPLTSNDPLSPLTIIWVENYVAVYSNFYQYAELDNIHVHLCAYIIHNNVLCSVLKVWRHTEDLMGRWGCFVQWRIWTEWRDQLWQPVCQWVYLHVLLQSLHDSFTKPCPAILQSFSGHQERVRSTGNFWGRNLSWISQLESHLRKFSPLNFRHVLKSPLMYIYCISSRWLEQYYYESGTVVMNI